MRRFNFIHVLTVCAAFTFIGMELVHAESAVAETVTNPTATPVRPSTKAQIDKGELLGHIQYLASPELRGREAGTPDQLKAAGYIAGEFKRYGLEPFGVPESAGASPVTPDAELNAYFQTFSMSSAKGAANTCNLKLKSGDTDKIFKLHKDFAPFPMGTAKSSADGGVVFAGYGIMAPEIPYDDFSSVDLSGKWALLLRYQPQESDPAGKFGGKNYTRHAGLVPKIYNCVMRRAVGVLIVTPPVGHEKDSDKLTSGSGPIMGEFAIPVFQISRETADAILASSGKTVKDLQASIDLDLKNQSFAIEKTQLEGLSEIKIDQKSTTNIIAKLPGRDEKLKDEYVVIGAHCDHVGLGNENSLLGNAGKGKLHPGADDNASGTAGLLEIAQYFGSLKPDARPKRSILFMSFSGEEEGLLGSQYYLNHPKFALHEIVAMLNLDMIGRSADGGVQVAGVGSSKGFKDLVTKYGDEHIKLHLGSGGSGPSDHASFFEKKIPVLFFSTGVHADYHRPTDTWDKINAPIAAAVSQLASKILADIADSPTRPDFKDAGPPGFLGVSPDTKQTQAKGYPVGSVVANSPAAEAGIKTGDVIVALNGQSLTLPMDLMISLIDYNSGDVVDLSLARHDERIEVKVKLGERKKAGG